MVLYFEAIVYLSISAVAPRCNQEGIGEVAIPQFGAACPEIYTALKSEGAQRFGFAARVACRTVGERVWPGLRYQWESIWGRRSQSWHTSTERGDRARFPTAKGTPSPPAWCCSIPTPWSWGKRR